MARFTRASFVEVLQEDYMRTARAKGVRESVVVMKHGLRNAMIPVVTMMGLQFGFLLGGSIVVERCSTGRGWGGCWWTRWRCARLPGDPAEVLLFSLEFILINLLICCTRRSTRRFVINERGMIKHGATRRTEGDAAYRPQRGTHAVGEFWRRFRRQRAALVAGLLVLLLIAAALLAPYLAPFDAENYFDYDRLNEGPSLNTGWAWIPSGAISSAAPDGHAHFAGGRVFSVLAGGATGTLLGLLAGYFREGAGGIASPCASATYCLRFPAFCWRSAWWRSWAAAWPTDRCGGDLQHSGLRPPGARQYAGAEAPTYIESARSIGAPDWTIILRHILPGTLSSIVVYFTLRIGTSIITAASRFWARRPADAGVGRCSTRRAPIW